MNLQSFCAVCLIVLCVCATAMAYDGKFPGKGNRADWEHASSLYDAAIKLEKTHQIRKAIALYKEAIAKYPYDADFYANLSLVYENNLKDFATARDLLNKAIELAPNDTDLKLGLVGLLYDAGKLTEARAYLKQTEPLVHTEHEEAGVAKLRRLLREQDGKR